MSDPVHSEARNLMENINRDPIAYYSSLLDFSKKYADNATHREVILLGSLVNEFVETDPNSSVENGFKQEINKKGAHIISRILEERSSETGTDPVKEANDIKAHFLEQKPTELSVFVCKDLYKRISSSFCLKDISLNLKLGEITGVVGENGNGKTSLLRIIAGELKPGKGSLEYHVDGKPCHNWIDIKRSIGYVKQTLFPWRGVNSVRQQLQFTAAIKGITGKENKAQFEFIIARLGLDKYQNRLWSELSGGYKLRFEIARQLIWQPRLLILDEPLANLDVKTQLQFLIDLRNLANSISHSMAVVISSQNLYEIEKISDHIVFLKDGGPIYNGETKGLGQKNKFRCYEIDTRSDALELQKALRKLPIREIRSESFYKLIFTDREVLGEDLMRELADQCIDIRYFRDITNSSRLLFEK